MEYENYIRTLKAMSDENRLKIIELLSCGTMCACEILEHFDFTQPTLSHHMKVLQTAKIVTAKKIGKWQHYTLAPNFVEEFKANTDELLDDTEDCICHDEDCQSDTCQTACVKQSGE